jgi:CO dehydrogenase nickel-insertion accessory protein CooC1
VVLNKIQGKEEEEAMLRHLSDFTVLGSISYNPQIRKSDLEGVSPYDTDPKFVEEIKAIKERLVRELDIDE